MHTLSYLSTAIKRLIFKAMTKIHLEALVKSEKFLEKIDSFQKEGLNVTAITMENSVGETSLF